LFGQYDLTLGFDDVDLVGLVDISPLPSKVVRLEAISSYHSETPRCEIALAFAAELFGAEAKENLSQLFIFLKNKDQNQLKQG
jgi:hypothetical protein